MEVVYIYILFAVTTAIAGHYELVAPVMSQLGSEEPDDMLVHSKWITHITMFFMNILFAPIIIVPTLSPSAGEWYRESLLVSLKG